MTFNICTVVTGTKERKEGEKIVTIGKEKLFFCGGAKERGVPGFRGTPDPGAIPALLEPKLEWRELIRMTDYLTSW